MFKRRFYVLTLSSILWLLPLSLFSYDAPVTTLRISQPLLTSLFHFLKSDTLTDIDLKILPIENQFELKGKMKGSLYEKLIFSGEKYEEEYPAGLLFTLNFSVVVLEEGFVTLVFNRLDFFEESGRVTLFNRFPIAPETRGQPHLVSEILLWLLEYVPLDQYLVKLFDSNDTHIVRNYFQMGNDGTMLFQFKPSFFAQFLPHPFIEELKLWGLSPVIDIDAQKFSLEVALGKGYRADFLHYEEVRRRPYPYFKEFTKDSPISFEHTLSIDGLNALMEASLPFMNSPEKQKQYNNHEEDSFLVKNITFSLREISTTHEPELKAHIVLQEWNKDNFGFRLPPWKTLYTEKISTYEVEAKLKTKDNNQIESELVGAQIYGIHIGKTVIPILSFFSNWIIPYIDNPKDDHETINSFVKLGVTPQKNISIKLNHRLSLPFMDFILHGLRLRPEYQEISFLGEIILPFAPFHQQMLKNLETEKDVQKKIEIIQKIESLYPKSTVTGKEDMTLLYYYSLLIEENPSLKTELMTTKINPLLNRYEKEYRPLIEATLKEKNMWTQFLFNEAQESKALFEKSKN